MSNKERLGGFLKALDDENIIRFDKKYFNHRLKLQKYVFIAESFGFKTPYSFSLYLHGPYSSKLADDYYAVADFEERTPVALDKRFVKLVKDKSEEWLELAATIIMIRKRYKSIELDKLVSLVKNAKPYAERENVVEIVNSLQKHGCLD